MTLRIFSYGGGVQSTAALVLAVQGKIDYPVFIFANVGDDSEHPDTLRYVHDIAMPYATANGIELIELRPTRRGENISLYEDVLRTDAKGIAIPVRAANGAPGIRACTNQYKVQPIARETKRRGASKDTPAVLGLGISLDEIERMNSSRIAWHVFDYPLVELRLARDSCERIVRNAGLPVPPKSACWFCPFLHMARWKEMQIHEPDLFTRAVVFERDVNVKQRRMGKPDVYFTRYARPLDVLFGSEQSNMFEEFDDTCESGFCMM